MKDYTGVLRLELSEHCWMVDYADTPEKDKIMDLFGTTKIPTPYTERAAYPYVLSQIQNLNPRYAVI